MVIHTAVIKQYVTVHRRLFQFPNCRTAILCIRQWLVVFLFVIPLSKTPPCNPSTYT